MPAGAPEVGDRGGRPGARGDRGPVRGGLAQEHAADERRDMVYHVNVRVHDDAATERQERRERGTREGVEVWIEERVALRSVNQGTDAPYDVDGHVVHGQLEKQLEDHRGE